MIYIFNILSRGKKKKIHFDALKHLQDPRHGRHLLQLECLNLLLPPIIIIIKIIILLIIFIIPIITNIIVTQRLKVPSSLAA